MKKKLLKTFKIIGFLFFTLIATGFIYEQISRFYFDKNKPADSEFIEIQGRKIHFKKQGKGNCTIIFESGLGGDYLHWQEIQKKLA